MLSYMKHVLIAVSFTCCTISLFAQQEAAVIGVVRDSKTKEPLPGVTVVVDGTGGTTTNETGKYELTLLPGEHVLTFRFVGYNAEEKKITLGEKEARIINIDLVSSSTELGTVVVSAGKFEQKIEEVTVSMTVVKPALIENTNTTSMETAMEQVPGVTMVEDQANIRGGSGFSYGAGSRVLLLVDDLPMLTADANDIKWSFIPVENLEQIEVIKGASSALFGSAAMNGIINIRTAYPKAKPESKVTLFGGMYDSPKNIAYKWWGNEKLMSQSISASHSRKIGNFDLVTGLNYFKDDGYRMGENEERIRVNANTRYNFKNKLQGLSVGVNTNYMHTEGGLFLLWDNDSTGALIPQGGLVDSTTTISVYTTKRFNIDPFITYVSTNGETHKIRTRFFKTDNLNNTEQQSFAKLYYGEYQFQKRFSDNFTWTWGFSDMYSDVESELYGNHLSNNVGLFTQVDSKWKRWNFSFGARWEQNRIDTIKGEFTPVFRYGINYTMFDNTHLRASYGQGYRFPSIAEKFARTNVGDINIFPNDSLQPETGFSAEFGINQGFKIRNWKGSIDVAGFWSEYKNMMEFTFGFFIPKGVIPSLNPDSFGYIPNWLGFQSQNIGNVRIQGLDFTLTSEGFIGKFPLNILAGLTIIYPIQTDFDVAIDTAKNTADYNILKYRYRRTFKADIETGYKNFTVGIGARYNSFMENIDEVFNSQITGVAHYRETHPEGDWVFDARLFYKFFEHYEIGFIAKNIFNHEYVTRPGDMQPPRNYVIQARFRF